MEGGRRGFYAPTATTFAAIQSTLRAAARTLRARNSRAAFDAKPESDFLFSLSQIRIMVQTQLGSRGT